jgi:hypothetical protein
MTSRSEAQPVAEHGARAISTPGGWYFGWNIVAAAAISLRLPARS